MVLISVCSDFDQSNFSFQSIDFAICLFMVYFIILFHLKIEVVQLFLIVVLYGGKFVSVFAPISVHVCTQKKYNVRFLSKASLIISSVSAQAQLDSLIATDLCNPRIIKPSILL